MCSRHSSCWHLIEPAGVASHRCSSPVAGPRCQSPVLSCQFPVPSFQLPVPSGLEPVALPLHGRRAKICFFAPCEVCCFQWFGFSVKSPFGSDPCWTSILQSPLSGVLVCSGLRWFLIRAFRPVLSKSARGQGWGTRIFPIVNQELFTPLKPTPGLNGAPRDVLSRNRKAASQGGFSLFLLYKFRIPSSAGFTARFWRVFWRGSCFVSMLVTFV